MLNHFYHLPYLVLLSSVMNPPSSQPTEFFDAQKWLPDVETPRPHNEHQAHPSLPLSPTPADDNSEDSFSLEINSRLSLGPRFSPLYVLEDAVAHKTHKENFPHLRSHKRRQLQGVCRIGHLVEEIEEE